MRIYKLLSVLLDYPGDGLTDELPALRAAIDEITGDAGERVLLTAFIDHLAATDPFDLQRAYVETFDLKAQHSLHLTHHLLGDDRNRGPALIDLGEYYHSWGVAAIDSELPDYLPLMLEFCSMLDEQEARMFLSQVGKVVAVLARNLEESASPWAPLLRLIERRATLVAEAA